MKFITCFFAALFIFASLISSAKIKNTQLFEVVQKTLSAQNSPSDYNSVFGNFEATIKNKSPADPDNSLFTSVNFSQLNEKNLSKTKSLYDINPITNNANSHLNVVASTNIFNAATAPDLIKKNNNNNLEDEINKKLNSASEKQEQKASLFRIEQQVKAETKSNISTKTQESLKSKQASDRAVKIDIDPKQIKKEIEESLEAEKQSEISSPIKKVAEIKDNSKIKKADKTVEKEQSQKVRKSENKKKDSHKSKQQSAKESEKAEAAAQNKKLAKAKKTKKATEKVENNSQSKLNPKEKTNLNNNNNNNKNSINKINEKNINKIINNNENKINNKNDSDSESAIESEIEKLKTQVKNLIQMNDALVKHLEKIDSKKRESKIDKNLIGFVQKYEGKVKEIDSKLKEEKKAVSADLSKKEKSLKNLFENTNLNFNEIKSQVKNLNAKLNEIEEKQKEKEDALKTGFEGDKLTIEKNLNVKGIAYSKKVFTKQINLQNVQISENVFKVKEDTRLEIGSESFDFSEIAKLLSYVETIKAHCGEDFELCGVVGEEEKMNVEIKKQQIVENLRKLKGDNSRVFSGKRGARDGRKDRNLRR